MTEGGNDAGPAISRGMTPVSRRCRPTLLLRRRRSRRGRRRRAAGHGAVLELVVTLFVRREALPQLVFFLLLHFDALLEPLLVACRAVELPPKLRRGRLVVLLDAVEACADIVVALRRAFQAVAELLHLQIDHLEVAVAFQVDFLVAAESREERVVLALQIDRLAVVLGSR